MNEYSYFYYKQRAKFTYQAIIDLDYHLKNEEFIKSSKKLLEKLKLSKSETMFINDLRDRNIESERKNNFEITDIAETESDYKKRIEKEFNFINNKKALFDEDLLRLNIFSIEPIYSLPILRRERRNIIARMHNFEDWKIFTTPKEAENTRDSNTGKIIKDFAEMFNEAEKNYKQFGLAETNIERECSLEIIQNYKKNGKYLTDGEMYLANLDEDNRTVWTRRHLDRELNIEIYGNFDGMFANNKFNEIEKKENYKSYGLPETVNEKVFRENLTNKINNWNEIPEYFKHDFTGYFEEKSEWEVWLEEKSELEERINNLTNFDFAETDIERSHRLETEENYKSYGLAESNEEREKRLEIENNINTIELAYSEDELDTFYQYTEILKIRLKNQKDEQ